MPFQSSSNTIVDEVFLYCTIHDGSINYQKNLYLMIQNYLLTIEWILLNSKYLHFYGSLLLKYLCLFPSLSIIYQWEVNPKIKMERKKNIPPLWAIKYFGFLWPGVIVRYKSCLPIRAGRAICNQCNLIYCWNRRGWFCLL